MTTARGGYRTAVAEEATAEGREAPAEAGERLARYHERRDFARTSEPKGRSRRREGAPRFVVQKHDARRLHYDVRLEADGVLISWAVPKGPSFDPADKRLAMRTEDHPLEYADFEGVIPRGEYGAGPVIVWDAGTYRNLTERRGDPVDVAEAVAGGHVAVWLEGEKLHGGFALTRLPRRGGDAWLMVKMRDEAAAPDEVPVRDRPESVRSGRTLEDLVEETAAPG